MSDGFFTLLTDDVIKAPDSASFDTPSTLEIVMCVAADTWPPAANEVLFAKYWANSGADNRSWYFRITNFGGQGRPQFFWTTDGDSATQQTMQCGAGVDTIAGLSNGDLLWLKFTFVGDDGAGNREGKFYYSLDPEETNREDVTWTQLGSTITEVGTTTIFNTDSSLALGAYESGTSGGHSDFFNGKYYYADLKDGIDGTLLASPDFRHNITESWQDGSGTDAQGNVWTATGATYTEPTNYPPVISPISDQNNAEGDVVSLAVSATDPDA